MQVGGLWTVLTFEQMPMREQCRLRVRRHKALQWGLSVYLGEDTGDDREMAAFTFVLGEVGGTGGSPAFSKIPLGRVLSQAVKETEQKAVQCLVRSEVVRALHSILDVI
jgi:hypothetical protein